MSANVALKVPAPMVAAANAVLAERLSRNPRQGADLEGYFLEAILRTIEADTAELQIPPKITSSSRPS